MSFSRSTVIDYDPNTGDSVKTAIQDLDTDLTNAYTDMNTLLTDVNACVPQSQVGVASGVASLDSSGFVPVAQIPSSAILPTGTQILWSTSTPPTNYLECNGASLDTTTYSSLFTVIGYTYGGSGSNFTLPDWRGRFPRGWDHGAGIDLDASARTGGDAVGSNQGWAQYDHAHGLLGNYETFSGGGSATDYGNASPQTVRGYTNSLSQDGQPSVSTNETRPINMNAMICIKWR